MKAYGMRENKAMTSPWVMAWLLVLSLSLPVAADTQVLEGTIGPGANYGLYTPENWNGDLVLYDHGYIDREAPIALPTLDHIEAFRDRLLDLGYAVAYSSYSENGLAINDAAQRTRQLRGLFESKVGSPHRTYLTAHSMGALAAVKLVETNSQHYDGVLSMCGMINGTKSEVDYMLNIRMLFDFFYPGVLQGSVTEVPEGLDLTTEVILPVVTAISSDPTGAVVISLVDQTPVAWSNGPELVESFVRTLGFHARGYQDLVDRTHGHALADNAETVYTGNLPPAVLESINTYIERHEAVAPALNKMRHDYEPTGALTIPMLTLYNDLDPVVPVIHEIGYAAKVADQGSSDLLVQRAIHRYGHCAITADEMVQAFVDLTDWVDNGNKPSP